MADASPTGAGQALYPALHGAARAPGRLRAAAAVLCAWGPRLAGLAAVAALAALAQALGARVPVVGAAAVAVFLGAAIRNAVGVPAWLDAGGAYASKTLLKLAIIGLGTGLSLTQVWRIGLQSLLVVAATVPLGLWLIGGLGRRMGLPPRLASLLGVGTAICGASAVAGVAPIIRAEDREVTYALATIVLFNTAAVVVYPLLGGFLNLPDLLFGVWAGAAIHDTSSVVAAAYTFSEPAGQVATVVKLTRTTLLVPVVLGFAAAEAWRRAPSRRPPLGGAGLVRLFPWFILGFLAAAAARTAGLLPPALVADVTGAARFLIAMAMVGIGLGADVRRIAAVGPRPLVVGLVASLAIAGISLGLAALLF